MRSLAQFSLKDHNTFGMDVRCSRFIELEHSGEVSELVKEGVFQSPFFILGGGSNILFTKDFAGVVVHPAFKGIEVQEENQNEIVIRVAAGEKWETLQQYCLERQLYGLENLIGIPGNVGSAPVQNIGAYGTEVKDCIESVEGWRLDTNAPFRFSNAECHFGYRDSVFKNELKNKCLITHVTFRLSKIERYNLKYKALADELQKQQRSLSLKNVTDCILHVRNGKLPDLTQMGSAGSFFKNPIVEHADYERLSREYPDLVFYPATEGQVKLAAGQLIEKAGWKGRRVGNAGVYDKQALVIVNYGGATPEEILSVRDAVIQDVEAMFHVHIAPEVNIL